MPYDGLTMVIVGGDRVGSQESYAAAAKQMVILFMNFLFLHLVVDNSHNFLTGLWVKVFISTRVTCGFQAFSALWF